MPTAFQLPDSFVLFEACGAQEYPGDWHYHQVIPQGTLALVDACMKRPSHTLLHTALELNPGLGLSRQSAIIKLAGTSGMSH